MQPEQTERLAALVASALECAVVERSQFLSDVCGNDFALREEAESLLRFENDARDFIETPAFEVAADEVLDELRESELPAKAPMIESEAAIGFESVSPEEPIVQSEVAVEFETAPAEEAIVQSKAAFEFGPEPAEAPTVQSETAVESEPVPLEVPIIQNEMAVGSEPVLADVPIVEGEAAVESEPKLHSPEIAPSVPAEETIFPSEAIIASVPDLRSPEIEGGDREEILNGVSEPESAPEPIVQSEATIDYGSELQSPEVERIVPEEIVSEVPPEKPKLEHVPASQLPAKRKSSFEVPAFPATERVPSRPVEFVWARRAAVIALALFVVAIAIGIVIALNSALRDSKNARHERDVAQTEQSRTERINGFLARTLSFSDQSFASVWPVAGKRNVTVIEALDRITPQVQRELADQPDVCGEVLRAIGNTYASQGQHDAAEKNLRAALQTQTTFYDAQNSQISQTMVDLGALLCRREKFAEAEPFLVKGVTFLRKQNQTEGGRSNAIKLAYGLDQLGAVKFYRGDVRAGRTILEEALQVARQAQPKENDRSLLSTIKTDLGGLLVLVGDLSQGETLLDESLAESRKATGATQWEAGVTLQMLGELALARNRPLKAGENFLEAEGIYRETLGEKNLYYARNLERRATVLLLENDLPSAEELARKSLAITKECSSENKLPLTDPMMSLSSILIKQGRVAEGEDYLRKTIRICEEQRTRNYAAIGLAKIRLSQLLLSQSRFTEAENIAFEAHNQAQQHLEQQDPMRKATTNNLIEIYERQEKHEAARAVK